MKGMKKPIFYGSSKIGERGQVVIPKKARKDLQIKSNDSIIFIGFGEKHLIMMKSTALEQWINSFSQSINRIRKMAKHKG